MSLNAITDHFIGEPGTRTKEVAMGERLVHVIALSIE
jgi:hypothetical protein